MTVLRSVRVFTAAVLAGVCAIGTVQAQAGSAAEPAGGAVVIVSVPNGRVVDLDGGGATDGREIQEWPGNGSVAQQWQVVREGEHHKVKLVGNQAWCVGRDQARVVLRSCSNILAEWDFEDLGGRFRIREPGGGYLQVVATSPSNGRGLVIGQGSGVAAEWLVHTAEVPRRPMPADPRLDQVTFLTSHNAMANTDEGFWGRFPNQSYRLKDQLTQGVRGLQLDAHVYQGDVRMCHGSCWGNERTLTAGLQDVVDFLNADRGAVVTLFIEDYTSIEELRAAVARVNGFADRVFNPAQAGVRQNGWPRISELVAQNRRLLVFSQRSGRDAYGVMFDRDWTAENYWSLGSGGGDIQCYSRWDEVPLAKEEPGFRRLHSMNHYRDIPSEGAAGADNGSKLADRVRRVCGPVAGRKPNYVALDFYQKPEGGAVRNLIADLNAYW
ncbi:RICIN domain-containing protein [Kribbella sp. CA-293567]|uniref:RICIN domain-containing protein n=1 Tax=Kribbella sp. CA-293567 TaxID=3002436 RepID=UPI0022DE48E8|nr:RICIN domain-containing protein [Kribbella sp. CA-293567]WBQ02957.1 RICIN domain-containing protein [Kribbella sp. CA-293567]